MAIAGGDLEGEGLAVEVVVALPVLAPVSGHGLPTSPGPFDGHGVDIACAANVGYEDQVEIGVAVDGEPYASTPPAGYPTKSKHTKLRGQSVTHSFNKR